MVLKLIKCFDEICFINPVVSYDTITDPMCLLSIYTVGAVYCILLNSITRVVFKSCCEKDELQHME